MMSSHQNSFSAPAPCATKRSRRVDAFTLVEMLMVLVIIAILAALALPHIRGHTEGVAINAATGQIAADLAYARQKAISQRSTVAMVFLPAEVTTVPDTFFTTSDEKASVRRLQAGAYNTYAIYAFRRVGEQPGQSTPGYLTEWKSLPEKTFFGTNQFDFGRLPTIKLPFPFSAPRSSYLLEMPYIAFDGEGRCVSNVNPQTGFGSPGADINLEVARGAILYSRNNNGGVASFEVQEIPPFNASNNLIHVDALTGRGQRILPEVR